MPNTLFKGARLFLQLRLARLCPRDHHLDGGGCFGTEAFDFGDCCRALLCKLCIEVGATLVMLGLKRRRLPMKFLILNAQAHREFGLLFGPTTGELLFLMLPTLLQIGNLVEKTCAVGLQATHVRIGILLHVTADIGGAS